MAHDFSSLESYLDDEWRNAPQKRELARNALIGLKSSLEALASQGINFTIEADVQLPLNDYQMALHETEEAGKAPAPPLDARAEAHAAKLAAASGETVA